MVSTLEQYKFFPYIAWAFVICAVFCTYILIVQLNEAAASLGENTESTVSALENGIE